MVLNIYYREENEKFKNGEIEEQIILDLESFLEDRRKYQKEHLDAKVKGMSHHYEEWTQQNQSVIKYAERMLECVKKCIVE